MNGSGFTSVVISVRAAAVSQKFIVIRRDVDVLIINDEIAVAQLEL